MLVTRKNIIIATEKVIDLDESEKRKLLLTLLETNPTCVLRALDIGGDPKPIPLYKVVLFNRGPNKINVIKTFREIFGAGLADAKDWAEGKTVYALPSGVFGEKLNKVDADILLKRVNLSLMPGGVKAEIVPQETTVAPFPVTWNTNY